MTFELIYGSITVYISIYNNTGEGFMIQVYLCEDQEKQLLYFKKIIEKYITDTHKDARVVSARKNPEHTLQDAREYGESPALFFVDVQLDGYVMDGFQLAREIKKNVKDSYIVFLTSCNELAYKAFEYELEAVEYIVKQPQDFLADKISARIERRMDRIFQRIDESRSIDTRPVVRVESGSRMMDIPIEDIVMVQAIKSTHQIDIYTTSQKIRIKETLKNMFEKLGEEFIYVNKSCFVQKRKIREIDKKNHYAFMPGGLQVEVSYREMRKLLRDQ